MKLIADSAHALDGKWTKTHVTQFADFTMFSFQAIKTLTTGDGGMLIVKKRNELDIARRIRWFGIDRSEKQRGTWENDIFELGYKYQMTDIAASIGLASLDEIDNTLIIRKNISKVYEHYFCKSNIDAFEINYDKQNSSFTPWMMTIRCKGKRIKIMNTLRENDIESAQVHYRNDRYSVFGIQEKERFTNMNLIENDYLVLPLHTKMNEDDAEKISKIVINEIN